jgi:thioredoxin-like negative regulator of GroEL
MFLELVIIGLSLNTMGCGLKTSYKLIKKNDDSNKKCLNTLLDLNGEKLQENLSVIGNVVVINKWATWCLPCTETFTHLNTLYDKYKSRKDFQMIWVTNEKDIPKIKNFIKKRREIINPITIAIDKTGCLERAYNSRGIPEVIIIGREGKVCWKGHPSEVEQPLEDCINNNPTKSELETLQQKASSAMKENRIDEAISIYEKLITQYPNNVQDYKGLLKLYIEVRKMEKACFIYQQITQIEPKYENRDYLELIQLWAKSANSKECMLK